VAEPIISVSGLRGIVGQTLTPDVAMRYVAAFASTLPPGPIVVSRDGRATGAMIAAAVHSSLLSVGRTVLDAGIAATPTLGVLVRIHNAAGGVQISASHNPPQYNGLKLFGREGRVIPASAGRPVLERYRAASPEFVPHDRVGQMQPIADTTGDHLRLVLANIDTAAIRARKFRVLLDSNAGSGSILGRRLLQTLGCEVTLLGGEPTGQFVHPPEPTAENLAGVREQVVAAKADVGFCQDPDADRLAVIDESGRYIGEEYTLALCLDHVLRSATANRSRGVPGPIVTNCASSRMAADLAAKYGVPFYRAAVGEANVVDKMLDVGALFGGEGSGGPIDPRVVLVRDSFVGMALILAALAARQKQASELADELPRYEIVKSTVQLAGDKLPVALAAIEAHFPDAKADRLDGLRLDWADRWVIIRGSNTEPLVRIIAEAPTAAAAAEIVAACAKIVGAC
jgi:phosphomannomutase